MLGRMAQKETPVHLGRLASAASKARRDRREMWVSRETAACREREGTRGRKGLKAQRAFPAHMDPKAIKYDKM